MKQITAMLLTVMCLVMPLLGQAKEAQPLAEDPVLEKRVMALSKDLRCLVCQNQTLADSHADFAHDMRDEIRELMKQGKSDREIVDFLVARYGDFIRFRPPMKSTTTLLWFGPLILLLTGGAVLFVTLKRRRSREALGAPLSADEHRRAASLLGENDEGHRT